MQLKLILKDNTEINLVDAGYTRHYVITCADNAAFQAIWDSMTSENLSEIQLFEDDQLLHIIIGSQLNGTQTVTNPDGTITGHFYLSGGHYKEVEDEYAEVGKILLGEED